MTIYFVYTFPNVNIHKLSGEKLESYKNNRSLIEVLIWSHISKPLGTKSTREQQSGHYRWWGLCLQLQTATNSVEDSKLSKTQNRASA